MSSRRPTWLPILSVATVVRVFWLVGMVHGGRWHLFRDNWFMSITMVFGSCSAAVFLAGTLFFR